MDIHETYFRNNPFDRLKFEIIDENGNRLFSEM